MSAEVEMISTFGTALFHGKAREKVLYGGSGSGKTYSVQQYLLLKALDEPGQASLVVMETKPGNLTGMFYPMQAMLDAWGVPYESRETAPAHITVRNKGGEHIIWFTSADKSEKMKYFDDIKRVVINEATALQEDDFNQLMNRMGRTSAAEIIFTFNPIDEQHWLCQRYVIPYLEGKLPEGVAVHHSTWHDNRYLSKEWTDWLESRMSADPNFYRVYALGEPGHLEGLIYLEGANWKHQSIAEWPGDVCRRPPKVIGVDFGFNDPTVAVGVWESSTGIYAHQLFYSSGMTQDDLAKGLKDYMAKVGWPTTTPLLCDAAEPARIEDLKRKGLNATAANKDIMLGIDAVKAKPLIISDESTEGIKELRNYRWKDKKGIIKDEPVDAFNHFCDSLRYAIISMRGAASSDRFISYVGKMRR